jgi:hypothetical protein
MTIDEKTAPAAGRLAPGLRILPIFPLVGSRTSYDESAFYQSELLLSVEKGAAIRKRSQCPRARILKLALEDSTLISIHDLACAWGHSRIAGKCVFLRKDFDWL